MSNKVEIEDESLINFSDLVLQAITDSNQTLRYINDKLVKCYEVKKCTQKSCPCFGKQAMRCWQVAGTFCGGKTQGQFAKKLKNCINCEVFKAACQDHTALLGEQFNNMMHAMQCVNERLWDVSREAGMHEVATGLLHNIGNILNSIKVTSSLLSESVGMLKVTELQKVVELIDSHQDELGSYFKEDPQGKCLLPYLKKISKQMLEQQNGILSEMDDLAKFVKHISSIIQTQQKYGKIKFIKEEISVSELIEDAIHLCSNSLKRHGVSIHRDIDQTLNIITDRHKLIQIIINIIVNAKQSLAETHHFHKREIRIKTAVKKDMVEIEISDTGRGISADNLPKIFNHGFTTRKEGHGFGLHVSALAANELKGNLKATSAGQGKGALFTLSLPLMI